MAHRESRALATMAMLWVTVGCGPSTPVGSADGSADGTDTASDSTTSSTAAETTTGSATETGQDSGLECDEGCTNDCVSDGSVLWTRTHDSPASEDDHARGVAVDLQGNIVVVGSEERTDLLHRDDPWIRKYDPEGNVQWTYPADEATELTEEAFGVAIDSTGSIVVVGGWWSGDDSTTSDIWVIKLDPSGERLWSLLEDGIESGGDFGQAVAVDDKDNIVVLASEERVGQPPSENRGMWLTKYDSDGALQWTERRDAMGSAVATDSDGNIVVVGGPDFSELNPWLRKYSPDGELIWFVPNAGPRPNDDSAEARAVSVDACDNIVVGGRLSISEPVLWLGKFTRDGAPLWARTHPTVGSIDTISGVATAADGTVFAVGSIHDGVQEPDIWVRKYTPTGDEMWEHVYDSPAAGVDVGAAAAASPDGTLIAVGYEQRDDLDQRWDAWIRKFAP